MARDTVKKLAENLRQHALDVLARRPNPDSFECGYVIGLRTAAAMMDIAVDAPRGATPPRPAPSSRWSPPPNGGGAGEGTVPTPTTSHPCARCGGPLYCTSVGKTRLAGGEHLDAWAEVDLWRCGGCGLVFERHLGFVPLS